MDYLVEQCNKVCDSARSCEECRIGKIIADSSMPCVVNLIGQFKDAPVEDCITEVLRYSGDIPQDVKPHRVHFHECTDATRNPECEPKCDCEHCSGCEDDEQPINRENLQEALSLVFNTLYSIFGD